jgi:hypothetical protein
MFWDSNRIIRWFPNRKAIFKKIKGECNNMDYETGKNFEALNEKLDVIIGWIMQKEKKKEQKKEEPAVKPEVKAKEKEMLKDYDLDDEDI